MSEIENEPLVSVILPVYNGARWVGAAIESVLAQTYRTLEILTVDDGSTDQSLEVLEHYAALDSRVRVLRQTNQGVARARNRAIAEARGDLIAPLDADDLWLPEKIELQVKQMLRAGPDTGFVYGWWVWIDENGYILDRSPRWKFEGNVFDSLLQINFTGNASVPLFRKESLLEAGGYNETLAAANAGGCEDWELALRIAERHEVAVVPAILLGYRRTPGSMSRACDTMWRSHLRVLDAVQEARPEIPPHRLRRTSRQFALYLAGLSYWSGDISAALRWGLRAGIRLPLRVAPYVLRMIFFGRRRLRSTERLQPGTSLAANSVSEPLIPYDRIYR